MRKIGFALLALSLVLGAVALWAIKSLSPQPAFAGPPAIVPRTMVVVATRPIGLGEPLKADAMRAIPWPEGAAPAGAFRTVDDLTRGSPRYALGPISANEVILPRRISGVGGRATLSGAIRAGMRASTIRIDDVIGVAGFVLPGDFVDVIVTRRDGDDHPVMRSDVLLQAVRVLAVDQVANETKNNPIVAKAATIEVSPAQAQKLALASQVGTLSLALRSAEDPLSPTPVQELRPMRVVDLRIDGGPQQPRPRVIANRRAVQPRPAGPTVEIFRGSSTDRIAVRSE
jgi:pilus assembly protein CpaB